VVQFLWDKNCQDYIFYLQQNLTSVYKFDFFLSLLLFNDHNLRIWGFLHDKLTLSVYLYRICQSNHNKFSKCFCFQNDVLVIGFVDDTFMGLRRSVVVNWIETVDKIFLHIYSNEWHWTRLHFWNMILWMKESFPKQNFSNI